MKRHVGCTSNPLDVVPWARATRGAQLWHGDEKRPPTEAASLSYAWRNARNISPSFGGSPCGGTGPFARQGAISTHRKAPLKWEKDQPSRDNDPPLFVVFDVDAFFSKLVFQVRLSARSHPNCSFRNNGESSRCPTLVPGDHHKSAWRRRSGGATYFFDNGTGSTGTGSSAPDFSNPTYCARPPPVSRKAGAW
jgi:hypothetical protein